MEIEGQDRESTRKIGERPPGSYRQEALVSYLLPGSRLAIEPWRSMLHAARRRFL